MSINSQSPVEIQNIYPFRSLPLIGLRDPPIGNNNKMHKTLERILINKQINQHASIKSIWRMRRSCWKLAAERLSRGHKEEDSPRRRMLRPGKRAGGGWGGAAEEARQWIDEAIGGGGPLRRSGGGAGRANRGGAAETPVVDGSGSGGGVVEAFGGGGVASTAPLYGWRR